MIVYTNCRPSDPIAAHPHAVYRAVIGRTFEATVSYLTGFAKWPAVVLVVVEHSASPAGFPIGSPEKAVSPDDTVAVIDYLAGSHPGAATVAELALDIDSASRFAELRSIERLPGVPKESDGGAVALAAGRDAAKEAAAVQAESETFVKRFTGALADTGKVVAGVAGLVALGAIVYLLRRK